MADIEVEDVRTDWFGPSSVAMQVYGHDLVHLSDIDEDAGEAVLTVFASLQPDAGIVWTGVVSITAPADE